jgi:hypothetical protein
MTFSMVVVAGNALMYLVCSEVADRTRFIYVDDREVSSVVGGGGRRWMGVGGLA